MVRFNSDRRFCRPTGLRSKMAVDASNDDLNRNQRLAVTEGAKAVLMVRVQLRSLVDPC